MESKKEKLPFDFHESLAGSFVLRIPGVEVLSFGVFTLHFFMFNSQSSNYYFGENEKWVALPQKPQVPVWIDHEKNRPEIQIGSKLRGQDLNLRPRGYEPICCEQTKTKFVRQNPFYMSKLSFATLGYSCDKTPQFLVVNLPK